MKVFGKAGMLILFVALLGVGFSYGQRSEEINADLEKQNQGSFVLTVSEPDAKIFIIPCESGIIHSHEELVKLRDAILEASLIDSNKELIVKPGKYLIAIKSVVPRDSTLIADLGSAAPDNLLIPSSKTGGYRMVIGGGPTEGCIFKKISDVLNKKYDYLKKEGVKELMFRFSQGEPTMELWLLIEATIKPGLIWRESFQVSPQ